jgi:hypothetical protein
MTSAPSIDARRPPELTFAALPPEAQERLRSYLEAGARSQLGRSAVVVEHEQSRLLTKQSKLLTKQSKLLTKQSSLSLPLSLPLPLTTDRRARSKTRAT